MSEEEDNGENGELSEKEKIRKKLLESSKIIIEPAKSDEELERENQALKQRQLAYALNEFKRQKEELLSKAEELDLDTDLIEEKIIDPSSLESVKVLIKDFERNKGDEPKGKATREPYVGDVEDDVRSWIDKAVELAQSRNPKEKQKGHMMLDRMFLSASRNPQIAGKTMRQIAAERPTYFCHHCGMITHEKICPRCGWHLERRDD